MAAAQISVGRPEDLPSSSAPVSPSIDLEDCIAQEMEAQAGISTDVGVIPYLRTPLLLHQKKNVLRMTQLEERGHGILLMDAIGMGKTLQTLCLILKTLNHWSTSHLPGSTTYPAPKNPLSRTSWDDARKTDRRIEPMLAVNVSQATLVVVQEANLQHWVREIRKHTYLPEHCVVVERGNPQSIDHLLEAVIILVPREQVTKLHRAAEPAWFLRMRFLRLVLDEGAASTAAAWKSRHSLMIQAIHADRKVLVDATPYDPHSTWLKEMGDTWVFFSAERNFRRVQLEWEEKVVKGRDGPAAARLLVQQFLSNHLVRSQEKDRPQLPEPIYRTISVQFNPAQAFAYNRIVTAFAMSCLYSGEDSLGNNTWLEAAFLNLKDCTLDAFAFDLVCNPDRLLESFDLEVLKSRQAFSLGVSDVRNAEKNWAAFLEKTAANVSPARLAEIGDLLRLHDPTGVALSRAPEGAAARACVICREDSYVPNVIPLCGHCICIRCLLKQKAENERRLAGGSSGSGVWTEAHLQRLDFRCACGKAFGIDDLWAQPPVCLMPYGLSYDGSPKLAFILDYVLQNPGKKVLIYICNAPHRDLLLNYFHSLGVRVAHYCLSGTRESVEGRAKIAREKELFALPAAQLPIGEEPVNVALVAGTTAAGGVRGTDLHATDVLLIVEPNLDPRVEKQLIGRVHRVGQTKRVEIVRIKVEGTFEDDAAYDLSMSKRERLLALRLLEPKHVKAAESQPNGPAFREAFPVQSVVWWARGVSRVRELATVRWSRSMHRTVAQQGKVFVRTIRRGKELWADPRDLTLCAREELLSFGPAQLGPHHDLVVKFALASEARYKAPAPPPAATQPPKRHRP